MALSRNQQIMIIKLRGEGKSAKQIATRLGVPPVEVSHFMTTSKGGISNGSPPTKMFSAPSRVKQHPNFTQADYNYLRGKGWDDNKILQRWGEEAGRGQKGVSWKREPHGTSVFKNRGEAVAYQHVQNKLEGAGMQMKNSMSYCSKFRRDTETCSTGCTKVTVPVQGTCPYEPVGSGGTPEQSECPCYS